MYSEELRRHVRVPIEDLNRADAAVLDAAIAAIRAWELSSSEIRALAESGRVDAQHIIRAAADGDVIAVQYVGQKVARQWTDEEATANV